MTWRQVTPWPAMDVTPHQVKAAILESGKTVREADGLMFQTKRATRGAKLDGNPLLPVLKVGAREFLWRDGRGDAGKGRGLSKISQRRSSVRLTINGHEMLACALRSALLIALREGGRSRYEFVVRAVDLAPGAEIPVVLELEARP